MTRFAKLLLLCPFCCVTLTFAQQQVAVTVTGIDFADEPGVLFVPAKQMADAMGVQYAEKKREGLFADKPVAENRALFDGTRLVALHDLETMGLKYAWDQSTQTASIDYQGRSITVKRGDKRAEINKSVQRLRAYQGNIVVLDTHVSTGRKGHTTPSGSFEASRKERMHFSRLYDDSPMPWAVQIDGNVFVHGFTSVPRRPASHGCVRVPLTHGNPAKWFWHWITIGTPVKIGNDWQEDEPVTIPHAEPQTEHPPKA